MHQASDLFLLGHIAASDLSLYNFSLEVVHFELESAPI
jgi:hypothetical protein